MSLGKSIENRFIAGRAKGKALFAIRCTIVLRPRTGADLQEADNG